MSEEYDNSVQLKNHLFCRARILYIDDDAGLGRLLQKRLERMAFQVDWVPDGETGLQKFTSGLYDLVITDYKMSEISGLEVLQKLKDKVPVIMVTGQGDEKIAVEAMQIGAADYVAKDSDSNYIELLPSVIDRVLERKELLEERIRAQAELFASEARYRAIVEDQTELICRLDNNSKLNFANEAFCRYFEIPQADVTYLSFSQILPRKAYQTLKEIISLITVHSSALQITQMIKNSEGKERWLEWTIRPILDNELKVYEYQLVGRDVTDVKLAEQALRISEEKNCAFLNAVPDQIMLVDRSSICVDLRAKKEQLPKLLPEHIGKNIEDFLPEGIAVLIQEHMDKLFAEDKEQVCQFELLQGNHINYLEVRLAPASSDEVLVIIRDVTARAKMEQQMQYLSFHDSLTGTYNRTYFTEEMGNLQKSCFESVGLLMCDIDCLKIVNDLMGHVKGDELIIAAARVIKQAFRESDIVARIGGDEFAVLIPNATKAGIDEAGARLQKAVAEYNENNSELFLGISIGASLSGRDSCNLGQLLQQADGAMYHEKDKNREFVGRSIRSKWKNNGHNSNITAKGLGFGVTYIF